MPKVLVVEDEVAIADALLYALGSEGFGTAWVRLAGEALALLRGEGGQQPDIDFVILDVGLQIGRASCRERV